MNQQLISELENIVVESYSKGEKLSIKDAELFLEKCYEAEDLETRTEVVFMVSATLCSNKNFMELNLKTIHWVKWSKKNKDLIHNILSESEIYEGCNRIIKKLNLKVGSVGESTIN